MHNERHIATGFSSVACCVTVRIKSEKIKETLSSTAPSLWCASLVLSFFCLLCCLLGAVSIFFYLWVWNRKEKNKTKQTTKKENAQYYRCCCCWSLSSPSARPEPATIDDASLIGILILKVIQLFILILFLFSSFLIRSTLRERETLSMSTHPPHGVRDDISFDN